MYSFNLEAHQRRFNKAVKQRKNYQDGCLQYVHHFSGDSFDIRGKLNDKGQFIFARIFKFLWDFIIGEIYVVLYLLMLLDNLDAFNTIITSLEY